MATHWCGSVLRVHALQFVRCARDKCQARTGLPWLLGAGDLEGLPGVVRVGRVRDGQLLWDGHGGAAGATLGRWWWRRELASAGRRGDVSDPLRFVQNGSQ